MNTTFYQSKVVDIIRNMVTEHFFINPEFFRLNRTFRNDFGFNSLEMTELVVMVEQQFGIQLPDEALENVKNVSDLVRLTEQSLVQVTA